jgi:hypothetical protein
MGNFKEKIEKKKKKKKKNQSRNIRPKKTNE